MLSYRNNTVPDTSLRIIDYDKKEPRTGAAIYLNGKHYQTSLDSAFYMQIKEISLSAIKEKYTELEDCPTIFTINGELIKSDCDRYVMDENAILQITFGKIENPKIAFVEILTKTKENIKKRSEFFVR
jgi:hypothetical protein